MTYEQTKEQFSLAFNSNAYIGMCETADMQNAIEALEKQIQKKPIRDFNSVTRYRCPQCWGTVVINADDNKYPRGQWCGQALKW